MNFTDIKWNKNQLLMKRENQSSINTELIGFDNQNPLSKSSILILIRLVK